MVWFVQGGGILGLSALTYVMGFNFFVFGFEIGFDCRLALQGPTILVA